MGPRSGIARMLRELAEGMERLAEEDFRFRLDVREGDGSAEFTRAFNGMAEKLDTTVTELRETRDYFEGIVENSADIIITVSPQGYIYTFNRGAEEVLGYSRSEMIGRHVETLFAVREEREIAVRRLDGAESLVNYETRFVTKAKDVRDVLLTVTHLRDPSGRTIGRFGIAKDVTETNRLHAKLLQSERFAAIGQALAGLQHSLKNMLNAMKGGAYMVRLGLKKEGWELVREGWEMVEGGIDNLTAMSSHMLSYVKEWKPVIEEVDLPAMVREIEGIFRQTAEAKGVAFRVEAKDGAAPVRCDRRLVHSAIMDILSNALDACEEKEYPEGESPEIRILARHASVRPAFLLSVRDNGCGMTPEVRANVFTPLFSTKSRWGTGLGMALTARTIRLHGGEIEVESEVNVGSEFRIFVPADETEVTKEENHGEEGAGRR